MFVGTGCGCCAGCQPGPWCVTIEWDLELDDVNDGLPPVVSQGSATVWVSDDPNDAPYALRKCLNGAAASDEPFTDAGCTGTTVNDFCDGEYVNYGGIAGTNGCLEFTFEFNDGGLVGAELVLFHQGTGGETMSEGVNNVSESYSGGNVTLTGTVTLTVVSNVTEENCGCP